MCIAKAAVIHTWQSPLKLEPGRRGQQSAISGPWRCFVEGQHNANKQSFRDGISAVMPQQQTPALDKRHARYAFLTDLSMMR
jgi:hypothetical protein